MNAPGSNPLLEVRDLEKHYPITKGVLKREVGRVRAVDGIDITVERGQTVGLVGESGCGKSTAATTILQLEEATGGQVLFDGEDVTEFGKRDMKRFRRRAQMIFQDPDSSFDPRMSIGESVAEPLLVNGMDDRQRRRRIVEQLLVRVGLQASDADRYPHEFSGGQKQRIALARALSVNPDLLVADEPVSALDVSIQAEILSIMEELQREFGLGILIISHNLGVIREICDRVGVMYLGQIVEEGPTEEIFNDPQHPYTRALISSIPVPDPHLSRDEVSLSGDVPSPSNPPKGCRFHTRCPEVIQPDAYDFDQETWRHFVDYKYRVQDGSLDAQSIRESVVTEEDAYDEPNEVPFEAFESRLRTEFSIPAPLPDERAEDVLERSIRSVYDGDLEAAASLLREEFETVCRQETPAEVHVTSDHRAACHLAEAETAVETPAHSSD
ncbi:ABC transporter ATP-binding protein [Natronosalvus rutilus]|uniref:ATP-binding cassette domain-containing protein n=1 Tax=Natronosalvus rutilus TaxID=2953753 RepID=A0A9E7NA38_9EURY|nr:oligopeptide/dipeptide ABC transporter ATP-binding protein [Natronosalvus rutilus]UTF53646.1 ATP-binding cassette domain-containing protein [Natronosalvus rutilus]